MRRICLALLTTALLAGCSNTETAASKIVTMGQLDDIEVHQMRVARENGFLTVNVALNNTSRSNQTLFYRFAWLDDSGFPVAEEEGWKALPLYGKQAKFLPAIAPTPKATDFRFEAHTR